MEYHPSTSPTSCFHCGQPVAENINFPISVKGVNHPACCAGCQAVAQTIVDSGLGDYYAHRQATSTRAEPLPAELLEQIRLYDSAEIQQSFVLSEPGSIREAALILEGITCAACVWLNEQHIGHLPGVLSVDINYTSHRARVRWDNNRIQLSRILEAIAAIGYRAHPFDAARQEQLAQKERKSALLRIYLAGFSMMQVMMYAVPAYLADKDSITPDIEYLLRWASLLLTLPVVCYSSLPFYKGSWRDLQAGRAGMDVPVALGVLTAFFASVWATLTRSGAVYFDSVSMFVFLLLGGRYLEMLARRKAGSAVEQLVKLIPAFAHKLSDHPATRITHEAAVAQLQVGDLLLVRAGETIPADGVIIEGTTTVDESLLTGESRPIAKQAQDELTGGAVNLCNPVVLRVSRIGMQSTLSGIVRLLDRAIAEKPRFAQLADRISAWFVFALLLVAAATAVGWSLYQPERALWITVAVLVISCPCALSLATPAALATATGRLARLGLLVTRGHALETLARVNHVVFDKTGTLTRGRMRLIGSQYFSSTASHADAIARALEQHSSHPIAQALQQQLSAPPESIDDVSYVAGAGLEGCNGGRIYRLGHADFVAQLVGKPAPQLHAQDEASHIYLGSTGEWLACYRIGDELKDDAASVVAALQQQGIGVSLLSGDRNAAVQAISGQLHIDDGRGELTPQQKLAALRTLQQQGKTVLMVGDGINDAPVLAAAQVSIAIGSGSDIARASGDMVLLAENLSPVIDGMRMAQRAMGIIRQNLWWALGYNVVALPLAIAGLVTPWLASIGMAGSSLLVVANALRLARAPQSVPRD